MIAEELVADFYNGAQTLQLVAAWAQVMANPQGALDRLRAFSRAYEQLAELESTGRLQAGGADFSPENRARLAEILRLAQPELEREDPHPSAGEIHALAERCLGGLTQGPPSSKNT